MKHWRCRSCLGKGGALATDTNGGEICSLHGWSRAAPARIYAEARQRRGAMDFDQLFEPRLELIQRENRYRVFVDLERRADDFPQAFCLVGRARENSNP